MKKSNLMFVISLFIIMLLSVNIVSASNVHPEDVQKWLDTVKEEYGGTTLTVSMGTHPSTDAFRNMADEFTELTGIKVKWDIINGQKLRPLHFSQASAGATSFDVWMVDGFYIQEYVAKDTLLAIKTFLNDDKLTPDWFDYEDIIPAYRKAISTVNEEAYGIPTAGESRFIAYRKDLFEEHNITPPQTTEELLKVAKYFKDEVPGIYGMSTRAKRGIFYASGWLHVLYQFSDGWIDQDSGEVIADSPEVIESLKYWNDLIKTGPPDIASYTHEEASSAFMTGDAAMWFDATAIAGWLIDPDRSEVFDKVGFLAPPEGPKGRYGGLAGWNIAIPKLTDKKEAAWAFIVWMTSKYNSPLYMQNGGVLVRNSLFDNLEITGKNPEMYKAMKKTFKAAGNLTDKNMIWIPPTWLANPVLLKAGAFGSESLVGDISEEEACKKLAEEITKMNEKWK